MKTKKITLLLLCVVFCFSFFGCSSTTFSLDTDSGIALPPTEITTYSITRAEIEKDSNGNITRNKVIAAGTLVFDFKNNFPNLNQSTLTTNFSLTYNNTAAGIDIGKTDTITATAVYSNISYVPITSTRAVSLENRENTANKSYRIDANYNTKKATYTAFDNSVKQLNLGEGIFFDNEMLYFGVRALKLAGSYETNFYLANLYDCFKIGKYSTYQMIASVNSTLKNVNTLPDSFSTFGLEKDNGKSKIDCYVTSVGINATNSGPRTVLQYSATPFILNGVNHNKVLIGFYTSEYDTSTARETIRTTYELTDIK